MFTTRNRAEAEALITLACPMNSAGQYIAPELAEEQTLENLNAFSNRLEDLYNKHINIDGDDEDDPLAS